MVHEEKEHLRVFILYNFYVWNMIVKKEMSLKLLELILITFIQNLIDLITRSSYMEEKI